WDSAGNVDMLTGDTITPPGPFRGGRRGATVRAASKPLAEHDELQVSPFGPRSERRVVGRLAVDRANDEARAEGGVVERREEVFERDVARARRGAQDGAVRKDAGDRGVELAIRADRPGAGAFARREARRV